MQARYASLFGCLFALLPLTAQAQYAYTITPLSNFYPESINDAGQVSGYAYASTGNSHAFYYQNGQFHDVAPPSFDPLSTGNSAGGKINDQGNMLISQKIRYNGGNLYQEYVYNVNTNKYSQISSLPPNATLTDINQKGDVAGTVGVNGHDQAFVYHTASGQFQYAPNPPGGSDFSTPSLNNKGGMVGLSIYPNAGSHVALFSNGVTQDLGNQTNGANTEATGINDAGDLCGYSDTLYNGRVGQQSFLYRNGQYINIGTLPGETNIYAYAINNSGDVVGGTDHHPILFRNGKLTNLFDMVDPSLGWNNGYAIAENDKGWIVGYGLQGGFLLKPVAAATPEPAAALVFAVGLGVALLALRRRKRAPLAR